MNISNYKAGSDFELIAKEHFESIYGVQFKKTKIRTGFGIGKDREFDLVNEDLNIIIECKNFRFTEGNNIPSAKISDFLKEVYKLYIAPKKYKKIICIAKTYNIQGQSLLQYIKEKYYDFIPDDLELIEL